MTKTYTFILLLLFISQLGFSQTEKEIKGKITCNNSPVQNVEVLNLATQKTSTSNENGTFSILGKNEDILVFVSKRYDYKSFVLKEEDFKKKEIIIELTQKTEQLDEVEISKSPIKTSDFYSKEAADEINLRKANSPKPIGVYDGSLANSADLIQIGKKILKLFKKEKETATDKDSKIEFKELAATSFTQDYFNKTLQLKSEEVNLFLEYCDADPKSRIIIENSNPLSLMDFLFDKNEEYKKLKK